MLIIALFIFSHVSYYITVGLIYLVEAQNNITELKQSYDDVVGELPEGLSIKDDVAVGELLMLSFHM